ncbi:MAG: hypothetical protein WBG34_09145, partial [Flavobacteriales bacterium]
MLRRALLLITILGTTLLPAQEKGFTLSDAILKARNYYPERLTGLQWIPNTSSWSYVQDDVLMRGQVGKSADRVIATVADLNKGLQPADSLTRIPSVEWTDAQTFLFSVGTQNYAYNVAKKTSGLRITSAKDAENEDHDEAYGKIAFTRDGNLFI